jgi:putative alpha-1,2-mannosidase
MTPFLYNYVPKHQWKTANQTRATVDAFYSDARDGYPGNIDGGALPSWLVFNLIGLVRTHRARCLSALHDS